MPAKLVERNIMGGNVRPLWRKDQKGIMVVKDVIDSLIKVKKTDSKLKIYHKIPILSNEGVVIATLLENANLPFKGLPSLTGISPRSVFNVLERLETAKCITKYRSAVDHRALSININTDVLFGYLKL